jgi:DNA-binding CsgD family transcriptional regulator
MNHLWIAYDTLLMSIGVVNVVLLYLARDSKPFLAAFAAFYVSFALGMFVALSRRYFVFNVSGSHTGFIFLSYGAGTLLSYAALACCVPCYHRLLGWSKPLLTRLLVIGLGVAAVVGVMPWSVQLAPDTHSYLLKPGYYVASWIYLGVFSYVMYLACKAAMSVTHSRDRLFARGLLLFAAVGCVESAAGLVSDLRHPMGSLDADGEQFLYSSVSYVLFSAFLSMYLLPLIGSQPAGGGIDRVKLGAMGLSAREDEVLNLLLKGLSNKGIANELHISEATVKTHLNKIFRKANVHSRFELARELSFPAPAADEPA